MRVPRFQNRAASRVGPLRSLLDDHVIDRTTRTWIWRLGLGTAATLLLGYVLLRLLPDQLDQTRGLSAPEQALERGRVRTSVLAFFIAVLTAIGALCTALTLRLSRRGQGTERFNKAIELLGDDRTSVRIGGIHALGQLASDDPSAHHQGVLEVLLAYVRDRSPWPPPATAGGSPAQEPPPSAPDIHTAMAILARRKSTFDPRSTVIDLSNTNLRGVQTAGISFRGARLAGTQLQDANLADADLYDADLVGASLRSTGLERAILTRASFLGADLVGARLWNAQGLNDPQTKLRGAVYDPLTTSWPDGFDPAVKGAVSALDIRPR